MIRTVSFLVNQEALPKCQMLPLPQGEIFVFSPSQGTLTCFTMCPGRRENWASARFHVVFKSQTLVHLCAILTPIRQSWNLTPVHKGLSRTPPHACTHIRMHAPHVIICMALTSQEH
jgi:hypothetical protein